MRVKRTTAILWVVLPSTASLSSEAAGRPGKSLTPIVRERVPTSSATDKASKSTRKRRVPGAPLVDSTLLRFVSAQKKQQEAHLSEHEEGLFEQRIGEAFAVAGSSSTPHSMDETWTNAAPLPQPSDTSWMGQYNRHRIAQKLMANGADEKAALEAGERVQSHVLMRMARRRVRLFLKERDSLWSSPDSQQLIEREILRKTEAHPSYGFDDTLEVMLEFGLTGKDVATILIHSPSLATMMPCKKFLASDNAASPTPSNDGETLEDTLSRSFHSLLLDTLNLRKYDARKVLRTCPGLLSLRGSKSAVQVVKMMTKLGVSTASLGREKMALPTLLSRSPAGLFRLVSYLCSDAVRLPISQIGPLIRRSHSRALLDAVIPVPSLHPELGSQDDTNEEQSSGDTMDPDTELALWGMTREERTQQINEVYRNMTSTIVTLRNQIETNNLGKLVAAFPSVLLLDAETEILPTAKFLMEELRIEDGDLASVLEQYPLLLKQDIDEMKKVVEFIRELGVLEEDLSSIFRAFPALLKMDPENDMAPVVDYLRSIGIEDIGAFVTALPPVLGYSVAKELQPKWEYLCLVALQPLYELKRFPAYLSYPFERVIQTRYSYLAAMGISRQLIPVDSVLRFGDADFAEKIARDDDGGKQFRAFAQQCKDKRKPALNKRRSQRRPKRAPHSAKALARNEE